MKIYTRTGDAGRTQIFAKEAVRLDKDDIVLDCYGSLDELNCQIGILACQAEEKRHELESIQQLLFQVGFAISDQTQLSETHIQQLEQAIDSLTAKLPAQTHFILPGGSPAAAQSHLCRAVCRRAERQLVSVSKVHSVPPVVLAYVNRLSDYFYVLARAFNHQQGVADVNV